MTDDYEKDPVLMSHIGQVMNRAKVPLSMIHNPHRRAQQLDMRKKSARKRRREAVRATLDDTLSPRRSVKPHKSTPRRTSPIGFSLDRSWIDS